MDNCMKIAYKSWPISTVISYSMKIFEVINVFFLILRSGSHQRIFHISYPFYQKLHLLKLFNNLIYTNLNLLNLIFSLLYVESDPVCVYVFLLKHIPKFQ